MIRLPDEPDQRFARSTHKDTHRAFSLTGALRWLILRPNRPFRLCFGGFVRKSIDRERSVVVPQSKPLRSREILSAPDRAPLPETSSGRSGNFSGNLDESTALLSLKDLIAAGDHRLEPMLATITDAARQLTSASGAALAMWKDGAMICRARSGDMAPPLGAQLSAVSGISGECLRTGKM